MNGLLRLSDEFWKSTILDAIWRMGGIILANRDEVGMILHANDAAARMFGYDGVLNSMQGIPVDHLVAIGKQEGHKLLRAGFNANPTKRTMGDREGLIGRRRDGTEFKVHIGLYPIDVPVPPDKKEELVLLMVL